MLPHSIIIINRRSVIPVVIGDAGGTYTLVVEVSEPVEIDIGALGAYRFEAGWYAYCGSALGPGGFSRVKRHQELAAGARDVQHWHIDYLLSHPETAIDTVVKTSGANGECSVARALDCEMVAEIGCSDCRCDSHLGYSARRGQLLATIQSAHQTLQSNRDRTPPRA